MEAALHPWPALGALLMRDGLVTREALEAVLSEQRDSPHQRISGKRLGEVLVDRGLVKSTQVAQLVAEQYTLPFMELTESEVGVRSAVLVPEELARRVSALPVSTLPDGSLLVAISDPPLALFSDELHSTLGVPLRFAMATEEAVDAAIGYAFERARLLAADSDGATAAHDASPEPEASVDELEPGDAEATPPIGLTRPWPALGALLIRDRIVTEEELDAALAQQRVSGSRRLGEILVERGAVTVDDVARLVAEQYELPFVDLVEQEIERDVASQLPEDVARRQVALPVLTRDGEVVVALGDPTRVLDTHELRSAFDVPVRFVGASPETLESAFALVYESRPSETHTEGAPPREADPEVPPELDEQAEGVEPEDSRAPEALATPAGLVTLFEDVSRPASPAEGEDEPETREAPAAVAKALAAGASHVRLVRDGEQVAVRARVDGVMRDLDAQGLDDGIATIARLKRLARVEAAERRTQQEGRLELETEEGTCELRLVAVTTVNGETVTLAPVDDRDASRTFADLGFTGAQEETLREALAEPFGAVLVCGPRASGRTTTLYSALRELCTPERAVATLESPVEHVLAGIEQVELAPGAGLTLSRALRALERSDVDVVGVGEIAETDSAERVLRAAGGRLVVATLEAHGSAAALRSVAELGRGPGTRETSVTCVVAQRLVRRICTDCRETYYAQETDLAELGRPDEEAGRRLLARGRGCDRCGGTGYRGRIGLFELLPVTPDVRAVVAEGASAEEIQRLAVATGMETLEEAGARLCLDGVTTAAEIRRVLGLLTR